MHQNDQYKHRENIRIFCYDKSFSFHSQLNCGILFPKETSKPLQIDIIQIKVKKKNLKSIERKENDKKTTLTNENPTELKISSSKWIHKVQRQQQFHFG